MDRGSRVLARRGAVKGMRGLSTTQRSPARSAGCPGSRARGPTSCALGEPPASPETRPAPLSPTSGSPVPRLGSPHLSAPAVTSRCGWLL